ncbi:MAG: site-specific integrase, partial [Chloroflexi bacterium]|nr:site-specific integrase [Chloroflexota bacterium]
MPDVLVPSLRESEMRGLLSAASTSRQSLRDQALVSLLLDTGIRLSELTALRVRDVDLVEG